MYRICDGLARWLAPILPVTADDLWRHMPGQQSPSVHLEDFPNVGDLRNPALLETWDRLLEVRETVNAGLEQKRKDKLIGNSLGAKVIIDAGGSIGVLLDQHRAYLPMLFIVSEVELRRGTADGPARFVAERAAGVKCQRCWRYVPAVSAEPGREGLCERCLDALAEPVRS